ncbi:MAG: T9SS type A sorting domain-containing protein [Candidatus Kapaibacterium sp.]
MAKITSFLIAFFLALPCFAQQPRIDSIAVDEDKGELVLYGSFPNSSSAIVLVDSISLPITLALDTLIRTKIPDSGKGSSGWVKVNIKNNSSNEKLLTYFHFEVYDQWFHLYSDGTLEYELVNNIIHVRVSISNFANKSANYLSPTKLSNYHIKAQGQNGIHGGLYQGSNYDSTVSFSRPIIYDDKNQVFQVDYWIPDHYTKTQLLSNATIRLDANYKIIHDHIQGDPYGNIDTCRAISGSCYNIQAIAPTDFPPSSADVSELMPTSSILQARLSSDPINSNSGIIITLQNPKNVQIQILDILGHIISSEEKMLQAGENKLPINASAFPPGMYICRIQAGGEVVSVRFVKE